MPKFEKFDKWIEEVFGSQTAFAEKMGVSKNTVSLWCLGKSQIKGKWEKKIRGFGYDGPLPRPAEPVTAEDLQALGRDIMRIVAQAEGRINQQIQAQEISLGAQIQEALKRIGLLKQS